MCHALVFGNIFCFHKSMERSVVFVFHLLSMLKNFAFFIVNVIHSFSWIYHHKLPWNHSNSKKYGSLLNGFTELKSRKKNKLKFEICLALFCSLQHSSIARRVPCISSACWNSFDLLTWLHSELAFRCKSDQKNCMVWPID